MLNSLNRILFQDLKCPHCEKMFCTKNYRDKHVDVIHHGIKRYSCDLCPYKSGAKSNLTRHLFSSHPELFTQYPQWYIISPNNIFTQLYTYLTQSMVQLHFWTNLGISFFITGEIYIALFTLRETIQLQALPWQAY